mgnify:CR=1 FL=1
MIMKRIQNKIPGFSTLIYSTQFIYIFASIILLNFNSLFAQERTSQSQVFVDTRGVLRWSGTNEEVHGFGVNYTVPFAHAYRSAKRMGIDPKKAIDNDVYHFSRLGFDLYRIHVWDTEISDTLGNLLQNEHLDTFDYLISKLKEHHINYVLTPIAFWGNGWPEPDDPTPGFSYKYGKGNCLTNPDAIKAQHTYLYQFLNHVNPYTKLAYKDDPGVIAFEVSNEPHHRGEAKNVTAFVKGMVEAMRKTGTKKPIFYNISHAVHFADAYFEGGIQGGTFQWYPTGLGYQRELSGNLLPNVNEYNIPFDTTIRKHGGAKLVYEFDAADAGRSYIYPAIARSFRTAGIQIATHFAYDPTYLAPFNTEYNTHYMNLSYAPQKALSLMVASRVFHTIPMHANFGTYPKNTTFDGFKVDYQHDLAEYNSPSSFIYTNTTNSTPVNEKKLKQIAGFGYSPVVKYDGLGAYFLDKIDKGVWRLEVMPDAVWVDNLFGRNSPKKTVAVINWKEHKMEISLSDLGQEFNAVAINKGNSFIPKTSSRSITIMPGTYILSKKGVSKKWSPDDLFGTNKLSSFYAPKSNVAKPWLIYTPVKEVDENKPITVTIQFIAPQKPQQIQLMVYSGWQSQNIDFEKTSSYTYTATIPAEKVKEGFLRYNIIAKMNDGNYITYPAGFEAQPFDWDNYDRSTYEIKVVPASYPIRLFDAIDDTNLLVRPWRDTFRLLPTENSNEAECQMNIKKLFVPDNENLNATPIYDYSFKHFILDKIEGRKEDLSSKKELILKGEALNNKPCKLQVAFVLNDGSAYGAILNLKPEVREYSISLDELKPVKTVTLPRPYPSFLPYYLKHSISTGFDINRIESIQFSIGPGIPESEREDAHGIGIINSKLR